MVSILLLYSSLPPHNDCKTAITNRKKHCKTPRKRQISHQIKKLRNKEKNACNVKKSVLSCKGCGMIAVKREVAAQEAGFPWSECQVRKLATSHCTIKEFCFKKTENQCGVLEDTHGNVYSHRLSYFY